MSCIVEILRLACTKWGSAGDAASGTNAEFSALQGPGEAEAFQGTTRYYDIPVIPRNLVNHFSFPVSLLPTMVTQCPASFEKRPSGAGTLTTNTSLEKGPIESIDSGYGSSQTTPDIPSSEAGNYDLGRRVARQLFSSSKKTKLRPFDQEISQAVQNRFSDLTELFGPSLYLFLVKRGVKYTAISVKLKVLGKDEGSARPWVVVQCDKAASKPINNFFDQPEVKSEFRRGDSEPGLPSFDVVIHPRAPVSLAASDQGIVYGKSWTNVDALCGNIIKIGSLENPHIATLGGIIKIEIHRGDFRMAGLTAGHIFTQEPVIGHDNGRESSSTNIHTAHSSCEPAPTHLNSEVQEIEDGLSHDVGHPQEQEDGESDDGFELEFEDFEIDTEAFERSSMTVELELSRKPLAPFQHVEGLDGLTSVFNPLQAYPFQDEDFICAESLEQSWSKIGSIYSSSRDVHARSEPNQQSGPDHDWALVDIDPLLYLPNLFADQPSGANMVDLTEVSDELDPPLYSPDTNEFDFPLYSPNMVELTEFSGELDKSEGSRAVILVSGVSGLKRGSLSLSPSFLMLGQANSFTKTYNLVLRDGTGMIAIPGLRTAHMFC